ncbi:MAG: alpha-glucosidase [Bacteroidota bacterium]
MNIPHKTWWKESVIYQIYPRSFKDSNGDGVGDLQGIISKLDHLKDLGIDMIWLSPMYDSPNDDNGYDIRDYYSIMKEFGSMDDFDLLLSEMKIRGLRLMLDLVVNHSSDEHQWFQESRKSKDNPYRDFYIWKAPIDGKEPNDWTAFFGGKAWELDPLTNEYYLHLFSKKQPDLNWENQQMRQEVYKMMRFWLDKGVSGFRMDVIPFISKEQDFPGFPEDFNGDIVDAYANGPRLHEFLNEMNREVISQYDVATVGEGVGVYPENVLKYIGRERNELDMVFHFDHMKIDRPDDNFFGIKPWDLTEMKRIFIEWDNVLSSDGWNSIYLGNHDFPRMVSRFGNDSDYHTESAKLLSTLLLTQRGTPYIYQGDEIGMTNTDFKGIKEYRDIQTLNAYDEAINSGKTADEFLSSQKMVSRDHARTPVQWDDSESAGFTTGQPWIRVSQNYKDINIEKQVNDPKSVLSYYKSAIRLRKQHLVLVYGEMEVLDKDNPKVFAYLRVLEEERILVLLNLSSEGSTFELKNIDGLESARLLLSNYENRDKLSSEPDLEPWEARVYKL